MRRRAGTILPQPPRLLCCILAVLLAACQAPPRQPPEAPADEPRRPVLEPLLQLPQRPPAAYPEALQAVDRVLHEGDWMRAWQLLRETGELAPRQEDYRIFLQARIAYRRGELDAMAARLEELGARPLQPALAEEVIRFRRRLAALGREYLASARLGRDLLAYTDEASRQRELVDSVWRDLRRAGPGRVQQALREAVDGDWQGWLELARHYFQATPDSLHPRLVSWRARHPEHRLNRTGMPAELQGAAPEAPPSTVALLLPLSGELGNAAGAVRDGYLARYFGAGPGALRPERVTVMDAAGHASPEAAYRSALAAGHELLIGPLARDAVARIATLTPRDMPVIALNSPPQAPAQPPGGIDLIHMALDPEDEARAIAQLAWARGARSALLLRPVGEWGNRVELALREHWSALGGRIAARAGYDSHNYYSDNVSQALGLDLSEQRAAVLRRLIGSALEVTPRRRRDLDVVFLLSRSSLEASALNPLLAFHYAGDLPVFSLSAIHDANSSQVTEDLEGVQIVQMPALIPGSGITLSGLQTGQPYARLYALGADAYALQQRLPALRRGVDILIRGASGLLTVDAKGRVQRELQWAEFDKGGLTPE